MAKEERSSETAERLLIENILNGNYPINKDLPGERVLSKEWGIARPALREAMQRLSRDGWLEINQGKPTRVRDYLQNGNLNILAGLLKSKAELLPNLMPNLFDMWLLIAPQYTEASIRRAPGLILDLLSSFQNAPEKPRDYAKSMWMLHKTLIKYSGNHVYILLFNSFDDFFHQIATFYYQSPENRKAARELWDDLTEASNKIDGEAAANYMQQFLSKTYSQWDIGMFEKYQTEFANFDENQGNNVEKNEAKIDENDD